MGFVMTRRVFYLLLPVSLPLIPLPFLSSGHTHVCLSHHAPPGSLSFYVVSQVSLILRYVSRFVGLPGARGRRLVFLS